MNGLLPTASEGWGKVMFSVCSQGQGVPTPHPGQDGGKGAPQCTYLPRIGQHMEYLIRCGRRRTFLYEHFLATSLCDVAIAWWERTLTIPSLPLRRSHRWEIRCRTFLQGGIGKINLQMFCKWPYGLHTKNKMCWPLNFLMTSNFNPSIHKHPWTKDTRPIECILPSFHCFTFTKK